MKKKVLGIYTTLVILITLLTGCSNIKNVNNISDNNISIENFKNPIIPEGFHKVETNLATWNLENNGVVADWNKGLVIEDENGNQFVWVPCSIDENSSVVQYSRYYSTTPETIQIGDDKIDHITNTKETYYYYEDDSINKEIKEMVDKYGGFYIGRYETGIDENTSNEKAVIKSGCKVLNNITASEALDISKNIVNTDNAKTYMMTSYCFDTTIRWLEKGNQESKERIYSYFANYKNEELELSETGSNKDDNINNIYDLVGNAGEFTTEKYHSNKENDTYTWRGINTTVNRSLPNSSELIRELYGNRGTFDGKSKLLASRVILVIK